MNRAERRAAGQRGPKPITEPDPRIVYSAGCSWWDSIENATVNARSPHGLPACPGCGSPLFEIDSEAEWWRQVDHHAEVTEDPEYRPMIEWLRGKCFRSFPDARAAYEARS